MEAAVAEALGDSTRRRTPQRKGRGRPPDGETMAQKVRASLLGGPPGSGGRGDAISSPGTRG